MIGSPVRAVVLLATSGTAALLLAEAWLPASAYASPALGAACVLAATSALLRDLPRRNAGVLALGAAAIGFVGALAAARGAHAWPLGFGAAWLPALLLFLGGIGHEQLLFELTRLENEAEMPALRPRALERAERIRDVTRTAARAIDPQASGRPTHPGDARAIHAYAAQVAGFALSLDGRYGEAAASLGEVPPPWMPAPMRALMLSNLSHWQLCAGDIEGAARTLERAPDGDAPLPVRPYLRGARAAVLVRSGDLEAAFDLVGRRDGEVGEPPAVRQRYRITRAHALSAKGEPAAARAELRRVVADAGVEELRRWLPAGGPARPAMEELIARGERASGASEASEN